MEAFWRIAVFSTPNGFADISRRTFLHDATGNSPAEPVAQDPCKTQSLGTSVTRSEPAGNPSSKRDSYSLTDSSIYFAVAGHASAVEKERAVISGARSFGERFASSSAMEFTYDSN